MPGIKRKVRKKHRRPPVVLHSRADIGHAMLRTLVPWPLRRIEVDIAKLPPLDTQRAQHRIRRVADASERQILGPLMAAAAVLAGSFYIVWNWRRDWRDLVWMFAAAVAAWMAGKLVDVGWVRLRMLLALFRLRRRVVKVERGP